MERLSGLCDYAFSGHTTGSLMLNSTLLKAAAFLFVIGAVVLLYRLTLYEAEDPCAGVRQDVGGAILADEGGDQDALVNRAIILRGKCRQAEPSMSPSSKA